MIVACASRTLARWVMRTIGRYRSADTSTRSDVLTATTTTYSPKAANVTWDTARLDTSGIIGHFAARLRTALAALMNTTTLRWVVACTTAVTRVADLDIRMIHSETDASTVHIAPSAVPALTGVVTDA